MMTGHHPLTIFYWVDNRGGRGGDDFEMEGDDDRYGQQDNQNRLQQVYKDCHIIYPSEPRSNSH